MIDNKIVVYNNGEIELNVSVNEDTIWLNQVQISELFGTSSDNISLHLKNIYKEKELNANSTVEDFSVVRKEGNRSVTRKIKHYNLDAIISVGYRISSLKATKFRQWATSVLKNYIQNGYAVNTHRITEHRLVALEGDVATIKSLIHNNQLEIKQGIFHDGQISNRYHDRFLIIDKSEAYHLGASLKDLGKKIFGFSKIDVNLFMDTENA